MRVVKYTRKTYLGNQAGDLIGCKKCDSDEFTEYNEKYDNYYCTQCVNWTESKCDCGDCPFPERPDKPPLTIE